MQRHSVTSLETARSLAYGPLVAGGSGGILRELQRLLSLIGYGSTGGVCGRSLTEGKFSSLEANMLPLFSIMTLWILGTAMLLRSNYIIQEKVLLYLFK